jgi:2'-5' RNA ligase
MTEQLNLFAEKPATLKLDITGTSAGAPKEYSLFFAIYPALKDAQRIAHAIDGLRRTHGLVGKPLSPDRLHISLQAVAKFQSEVPQHVVDAARAAAARVTCPSLLINFDRMSFHPNETKAACVFHCDRDSSARIAPLRTQLGESLRGVGLHPKSSSEPHMTMLYDKLPYPIEEQIEPIEWTATRFVLVLSHVGASHHQWIDEWPLAGRSFT